MKPVLPPDSVTETESDEDVEMEETTKAETNLSTPKKVMEPVFDDQKKE